LGHLFKAPPALAGFQRKIDPTKAMNPGIGQTSPLADWIEAEQDVA
jgi:D-lactate dehydrogenase